MSRRGSSTEQLQENRKGNLFGNFLNNVKGAYDGMSFEQFLPFPFRINYDITRGKIPYDKEIMTKTRISEMLDIFNAMMDCIIDAFENEDPSIARKVFKKDKLINKINSDSPQITIDNINKYDKNMLLYLLSSIRKIERAADSLKKIAEEIIYHLEAKIVKHKNHVQIKRI